MKNGDLTVINYMMYFYNNDGSINYSQKVILTQEVAAKDVDFMLFTQPAQMTEWEFAAYNAYTDDRCNSENIQTLNDLFGQEFSDKFFSRKYQLIAMKRLKEYEKEMAQLQKSIDLYREFIANPKPNPRKYGIAI